MDSVVAMLGLSCFGVCGIPVPRPETEPTSPALQGGFLIPGHQGSPGCDGFGRVSPVSVVLSITTHPSYSSLGDASETLFSAVCSSLVLFVHTLFKRGDHTMRNV